MTVPLTSTVIVLGPGAAGQQCLHRHHAADQSLPPAFQAGRLTQSRRTALKCRPRAQTNHLPLARPNPGPTSTTTKPRPLSPSYPTSRGFVQSGFCEVAVHAALRASYQTTSQNPQDSQISSKVIHHGNRGGCDGPGCCGADGLHGRRGSPACEGGEGCGAGAGAMRESG